MTDPRPTPPPVDKILDLDFLEARAKLLDLAAFLDRIDRAVSSPILPARGEKVSAQRTDEGSSSPPPFPTGEVASRSDDGGGLPEPSTDHRLTALRQALPILLEEQPGRAERIQLTLSDPTTQPVDKATTQGATGAWPGRQDNSSGGASP